MMGLLGEGKGIERCGGVGDDAIIPQCWECDNITRWGHNHNVIGAGIGTRCAGLQHHLVPLGSVNRLQHTGLGDNAIVQHGRWTCGHRPQDRVM